MRSISVWGQKGNAWAGWIFIPAVKLLKMTKPAADGGGISGWVGRMDGWKSLQTPLCNADNNNSSSWDVGVVALVCSDSCPELVFCKLRKTGMRNTVSSALAPV